MLPPLGAVGGGNPLANGQPPSRYDTGGTCVRGGREGESEKGRRASGRCMRASKQCVNTRAPRGGADYRRVVRRWLAGGRTPAAAAAATTQVTHFTGAAAAAVAPRAPTGPADSSQQQQQQQLNPGADRMARRMSLEPLLECQDL